MKILISPRPFQTKGYYKIEELRKKGYSVVYNDLDRRFTREEVIDLISDADAIITGNDPLDADVLSHAKNLKVIAKYGVGLDNIDTKYAENASIKVCKALGTNNISVAEMTIELMLASSRNLYTLMHNSKNNIDKRILGSEVYNKTIGIIGIGAIGKHVAKICDALGMKVLACDPYASDVASYVTMADIDDLLLTSDYVSLHVPLFENTKNMVNSEFISKMKKGAILINTARAELIENDALYNALTNGYLSFVAEDVELVKRQQQLIDLPNYIITPHSASFTAEADINTIEACVLNILNVLEG